MTSFCDICGKSQVDLLNHKRIHDNRIMECEECGKKVSGLKAMNNHKMSHKMWNCDSCSQILPMNSKNYHKKQCNGQEEKEISCSSCSYITNSNSYYL